MPTISSFFGIFIRMYYRDHAPPHFHAVYAGQEAAICIETLTVIEGRLSRRALNLVLGWRNCTATHSWKTGLLPSSANH